MKIVDIQEAASDLPALLARVETGEEVVIARHGWPIARLVLIERPAVRELGAWRRLEGWSGFRYDPALFAPLGEAERRAEGWP